MWTCNQDAFFIQSNFADKLCVDYKFIEYLSLGGKLCKSAFILDEDIYNAKECSCLTMPIFLDNYCKIIRLNFGSPFLTFAIFTSNCFVKPLSINES